MDWINKELERKTLDVKKYIQKFLKLFFLTVYLQNETKSKIHWPVESRKLSLKSQTILKITFKEFKKIDIKLNQIKIINFKLHELSE